MVTKNEHSAPVPMRGSVADRIGAPHKVPSDAPWNWLAAGWRDLWQAPVLSLGYGAIFASVAAFMLWLLVSLESTALFLPLVGGFLLVGPFLAVGLYQISRKLAAGEAVTTSGALFAGWTARGQLAFFGIFLLLLFFAWTRLAVLLLLLFLGTATVPPPQEFMQILLFTGHGLGLLVTGTLTGAALAMFAYAISCVSVPLLLVRSVDAFSAAGASVAAVQANPGAMLLWAALIVVMIAAGFATLLLGLVVVFPLVGHATWHAYAELYGDEPPAR